MGKQTSYKVALEGTIGLQNATSMHAQLLDLLQHHKAIEIDARAVEQIDMSGLQLLAAAAKTAESNGISLTLRSAPESPFLAALVRGGFMHDGEMIPALRSCWHIPNRGGSQ